MKKVLTMTLNPCIDKTIYLDTFQVGGTNIVRKTVEEVAGKGINVAVGLKHLDVPVKAMGFAYKEDKDKLYGKLNAEQIPYSFVEVEGCLRVNQKIFDESKLEMTECNEKGTPVAKEDVDELLTTLRTELADASILVLSGSVPPGVDKDIYAVMTSMASEMGVKVILDASGELLREGVKAKPYLIKPNREEFERTFLQNGVVAIDDVKEMVMSTCNKLLSDGLTYICLSLGAEGAMLFGRGKSNSDIVLKDDALKMDGNAVILDKRPAIPIPIRSLQGAGDAMVAGLCKAIYEEREDEMLDYALAMAASTITLEGTAIGRM